jgi:hypothetical protein
MKGRLQITLLLIAPLLVLTLHTEYGTRLASKNRRSTE